MSINSFRFVIRLIRNILKSLLGIKKTCISSINLKHPAIATMAPPVPKNFDGNLRQGSSSHPPLGLICSYVRNSSPQSSIFHETELMCLWFQRKLIHILLFAAVLIFIWIFLSNQYNLYIVFIKLTCIS